MVARTTLGPKGSAHPWHQEQAVRLQGIGGAPDSAYVPRVLGDRPAPDSARPPGGAAGRCPTSGTGTAPPGGTPWGRWRPSHPPAPGTVRTSGGSSGPVQPLRSTPPLSRGAPHFRASSSSLTPSPRNIPAERRAPRLEARRRIWTRRGFFRLVIHSSLTAAPPL